MTKRSKIKSSVAEIVDYWSQREDECGLSIDWVDADERCWRCARKARLQRCHIVPDSLGGSDRPSNLVLLCDRCHCEAPDVSDPRFMWKWLRRNAVSFYDTDWIVRGISEFEKMFGRMPFANVVEDVPKGQIENAIRRYRRMSIVHFGEGRPSPSTVCWILNKIEQELLADKSN